MPETFRTRFGLIVALLGMAIGTGNIWRFPRVMAANGGGAFFIPWFLFLLLWSVPLLIVEFTCGQRLRQGVAGSFAKLTNGRYTWLGAFVVFCTLGIMFYYSVVTGWCLYYLLQSVTGQALEGVSRNFWEAFTGGSPLPLLFQFLSLTLAAYVLAKGVRSGIEAVSVFMIPALFLILAALALYAVFLPGSTDAFAFMFNTDFSRLGDYKVWLEALTQSAWSTGAGWGIALSYACYARWHDRPVLTPFTTGLGNNSIELLAALMIMPTLFTFFPLDEVIELTGRGNTGLTFIALPGLFQKMFLGQAIAVLFFAGLFFAAFTSLISMLEIGVRFFQDMGVSRAKAVLGVAGLAMLIGAPSALNLTFLENQDWVWGIGLLLNGFFFAFLMRHIGMRRFCGELLPIRSPFHRFIFKTLIFWIIPFEFLVLTGWWFYQSVTWDPASWWNPLHTRSIGTCLLQWGALAAVLFLLNRKMSENLKARGPNEL